MPDVNPFQRKKQPTVRPVDPVAQQQLLARAAGATRQPPPQAPTRAVPPTTPLRMKAPPPANAAPGITGNPPIPTGRAVSQIAPSGLTDVERQTLEAVGWTEEIGLPQTKAGIEQFQQIISQHDAVEVPLPVDPRTPPLKVKTVDIDSLPPAKQKEILDQMQEAMMEEHARNKKAAADAEWQQRDAAVPGIGSSLGMTDKSVADFDEKIRQLQESPANDPSVNSANSANSAPAPKKRVITPPGSPTAATPPPPPAPAQQHVHSETGADAPLEFCPHCYFDLSQPDIPEPPHSDKMAFLHCLLGMKSYTKDYSLFGGSVTVKFRTLTTREIDIVFKQAYRDYEKGEVTNEGDFRERINRYRLMLQLQEFKTDTFHREMPDGYSKTTNPNATGVWVQLEDEADIDPKETGLPDVADWMVAEVMASETVFRVCNMECAQFNRLVAKMEAMADNSDFWKATEPQS